MDRAAILARQIAGAWNEDCWGFRTNTSFTIPRPTDAQSLPRYAMLFRSGGDETRWLVDFVETLDAAAENALYRQTDDLTPIEVVDLDDGRVGAVQISYTIAL